MWVDPGSSWDFNEKQKMIALLFKNKFYINSFKHMQRLLTIDSSKADFKI